MLMMSQASAVQPKAWEDRTAWVVATIQHSEWCPAGNVRLDLQTGEYFLTELAKREVCQNENLERPIVTGKLHQSDLSRVRLAFTSAEIDGLAIPECRNRRDPGFIIVTNGGVPMLALTTGAWTDNAPERLECWSKSANSFHDTLEEVFKADP